MEIIQVEGCICEERANKIEKYWKDLYKKIEKGGSDAPTFSISGMHCTSTTMCSVFGETEASYGSWWPEQFLYYTSTLKQECGKDKDKLFHYTRLQKEARP